MLIETLPFSLGVPADERLTIQTAMVGMAEEVLNIRKSALEAAVAAEDALLTSLQDSEAGLAKAVSEAQAAFDVQIEKVQLAKSILADATSAADASLQVVNDRQEDRTKGDAKMKSAMDGKLALESAFQTHFRQPMDEGVRGPSFKELEPFLHDIELEPSLATALPSSCAKAKSERGNFDDLVLQELEKSIAARLAAFGDLIMTETPASVERAVAAQVAKQSHEEKVATQKAASVEFEAMQKKGDDCKAELMKAKEACENLKPQLDALKGKLDSSKTALSDYEAGTYGSFMAYTTKVSLSVEEQVAPAGA